MAHFPKQGSVPFNLAKKYHLFCAVFLCRTAGYRCLDLLSWWNNVFEKCMSVGTTITLSSHAHTSGTCPPHPLLHLLIPLLQWASLRPQPSFVLVASFWWNNVFEKCNNSVPYVHCIPFFLMYVATPPPPTTPHLFRYAPAASLHLGPIWMCYLSPAWIRSSCLNLVPALSCCNMRGQH